MDIVVIGGGPAGLYFSIMMMKSDPSHNIRVFERNERGDTYGWGVVFSEGTLENLEEADRKTYDRISDSFAFWDDLHIYYRDRVLKSSGHGFCGIARTHLLEILTQRAEEFEVDIEFGRKIEDESQFTDADLIVAADGINSGIREKYSDVFQPEIDVRSNKFIWLGTKQKFDAFTFLFEETDHGWFIGHCYQFDDEHATFIVECTEETWKSAGIHEMEKQEGVEYCEDLFSEYLDGHRLITNNPHVTGSDAWRNFKRVHNEKWYKDNVVLLGDAAATLHFSIGSGTKLAMESAIALVNRLNTYDQIEDALDNFDEEQRVEYLRLQSAARNSCEWFENIDLKMTLEPEQLGYSLITRSQRVWHEDLRERDADYLREYEKWWARRETGEEQEEAIPPMFHPYEIRDMRLRNRVVQSPMAMYSAEDGKVTDFHYIHFGSRAMSGIGMMFTEMVCVNRRGRITPGCAGLYKDEHTEAWKRIVEFVHRYDVKFGLQLGHSGRKGSTRVGWEGYHKPLDSGNWEVIAPSPIPWKEENQTPRPMTEDDMKRIRDRFVENARRGEEAGFDMLELHCAHGYLLSSFLSPLTNRRDDKYGGSLENRLRFPLEIFDAVRDVWPDEKPISVRISATDWKEGGNTVEEAVEMSKAFKEHGCDIIDVSTGMVVPDEEPVYGRMFQVPHSERIRIRADIPTMAVGNIYDPDHVNSILAAGRADLTLLARPHLWDPFWFQHAAAELGYEDTRWPKQYRDGKDQLERLAGRQVDKRMLGPI